MDYLIRDMDKAAAAAICRWQYPEPYGLYNIADDPAEMVAMLDGCHRAVYTTEHGLVGFYCFGPSAQIPAGHRAGAYVGRKIIDMGLGLRPDCTGQGWGTGFVQAGVDYIRKERRLHAVRLTVAAFNQRALKVYERVGFNVIDSFYSQTPRGAQEFFLLLLPLENMADPS